MNTKIKNKAAALKFANQVRKALGKKPIRQLPLGIPCRPESCPLALAIEDEQVRVTEEGMEFVGNPVKVYVICTALGFENDLEKLYNGLELDKDVIKFIRAYDSGKYPELVDVRLLSDFYNNVN